MSEKSALDIVAYGAWNGGTAIDNSIYENQGMFFKGGIPVTDETIQSRVGVRTRIAAPEDQRIGTIALQNLIDSSDLDFSKTKIVIGATNVGDDKIDPGPQIKHNKKLIDRHCAGAMAFDLYGGCPGFNVSIELLLMLSLSGYLNDGDLSIIVGAENIHRAKAFKPLQTANIIFGDDSMATALRTQLTRAPSGRYSYTEEVDLPLGNDYASAIASAVVRNIENTPVDGLIIDNQLGRLELRIPASAARVQRAMVELMFPDETKSGVFDRFTTALAFYDENVKSFAFDIKSLDRDPSIVKRIARAYVESGKYRRIASVFVSEAERFDLTIHKGEDFVFQKPKSGVVDAHTRTHGCFADYIHGYRDEDGLFGSIDGKGVFLYATRGASGHLAELLHANGMTIDDVELLVEHQANFAMIPATLARVLGEKRENIKELVWEFIADRMVTNIHLRGNTSVVCMQRLPFDLERGALKPDTIQGFAINQNVEKLRKATKIFYDSVGAGMTRSSFILRKT